MDEASITPSLLDTFADVEMTATQGYTFFYCSDHKMPFATLATQDDEYDHASHLNRPSVFRLNMGVNKSTFRSLFGPQMPKPTAGGAVDTGQDFTVLDQLLPHPVYAPQAWVCALNPSLETFQTVRPLLAEAYELAASRHAKHEARS